MAERPSVKEILAAARQKSPGAAQLEAVAPESKPAEPDVPRASEAPLASPVSGRPLTLKEKLAAARSGAAAATPPIARSGAPEIPAEPAASSGARPLSVKEKLAAARAGGGAAAVSAEPPAVTKPAPAAKPKPSAAEIRDPKALASALRRTAEAKEKTPLAVIPKVETPAPKASGRRGLLAGGVVLAAIAGGLGWLIRRVLAEPPRTVKVGAPSTFKESAVLESADWDFRVVRLGDRIVAIRSACTHLGCAPGWNATEKKFRCPCHGSAFDASGVNIEGPAPRPLERYKVTLAGDGQVVVDRSRTFRKDLDEWDDPASFVPAG